MPIPIPEVHLGLGAATIRVSVPLALNLIPRNRCYGVRTRQALASDRNWQALNAFGGRLLLIFGVFLAGFGYLTRPLAPAPTTFSA